MDAICSSETLVDFQLTTRPYIPDDNTLELINLFLNTQTSDPAVITVLTFTKEHACHWLNNTVVHF
jgi:hypothetical protein